MPNELIIQNLSILQKEAQKSKEAKDRFRAIAYGKAIKAIKAIDHELTSGAEARKISGIGKRIADKIQEIIDTGKLTQVTVLGKEEIEKTAQQSLFGKIWGVGPVKAQELWEAGARSLADIQDKYQHLLTDNQQIGLRYFDDLQQRVPRWQITELIRTINYEIGLFTKKLKWQIRHRICGSYRRKSSTIGDIDLLLYEKAGKPILNKLVKKLTDTGFLIESLGLGPSKYMGITRTSTGIAFRIDIELIKEHEWPFALLYFTGSGQFNERQRLIAKKMGFSLSEHGLRNVKTGEYVQGLTSEKKIFEYLGMTYIPPWDRN